MKSKKYMTVEDVLLMQHTDLLRVLVCGDRKWTDYATVQMVLNRFRHRIELIIEGEALGADTWAREYAQKYQIPLLAVPAQWTKFGKRAGAIRNGVMLKLGQPHCVIAFHDNIKDSKGTANMIAQAVYQHIPHALITHDKTTLRFV